MKNPSSDSLKYINHPLLHPNTLIKRDYQVNIFVTCSKTNCLVVIPTGLGKTIIALLLCLQRIKNEEDKIIFLAPTRPLVEQHKQTFESLTVIDNTKLVMMTGNISPDKREILYNHAQVLFLTPQILQNDLIANRLSLKQVSLLIFDEAHRATGNYAYTYLAKKYQEQATNARILAITASPGKNREIIEEVMQNLFLDSIEIRTESDPDVKPYIQDVETEWVDIELPDEMYELLKILEELEKRIYLELQKNDLLDNGNLNQISRKALLTAGKKLDFQISRASQDGDLPRLLFLKKMLSNGIRLSHMAELIEAQGIASLIAFIEKNLLDIKDGKAGKSAIELFNSPSMEKIQKIAEDLQKKGIDHPKLAKLMTILVDQLQTTPSSRVLVFCHFRDTVQNIVEEINKNRFIRAERFIGQQSKGSKKGFTQKEQLEILQRFKDGELNVLVATSVAEEGLDISECDIVIFYDIVASEIRSIQRRGRTGRNREGKVYIFKTKGTREEGYFWAEKHREKEMKRVLKEIKKDLAKKTAKNLSQNTSLLLFKKLDSGQKSLNSFLIQNQKIDSEISNKEGLGDKRSSNSQEYENKGESNESEEFENFINRENIESINNDPSFNHQLKTIFTDSTGNQPFIIVDSRETASPVTRTLSELKVDLKLQILPTGDYILSERVGVERKSIQDLVDSIKDGRLFSELNRLRSQFSHPILIIEGDLNTAVSVNRSALLGAISSIMLKMNIMIFQTSDAINTAETLIAFAKKEQNATQKKNFSIRFKKIPEKFPEQLEYIVSGIPGINIARAQDLLREFGTLKELFMSNPEEMQKVPNIGPKLAEKISHFASTPYRTKKLDLEEDKES